jgi:hypothetical protein
MADYKPVSLVPLEGAVMDLRYQLKVIKERWPQEYESLGEVRKAVENLAYELSKANGLRRKD